MPGWERPRVDVVLAGDRVVGEVQVPADARVVDLEERWVMAGLLNGHDHLDFSTFPALGHPPYANAYAWAEDLAGDMGDPAARS